MKFLVPAVLLCLCAAAPSQAQTGVPKFKDYPAEVYTGPNAPVVLTRDNRMFRTRLREAAREKPNFAGRYILTTWGCGTTCVMGAVIDARTGRVYWLPGSICCWFFETDENFEPIVARPDSTLIVLSGMINEEEKTLGTHFYNFQNGKFVLIHRQLKATE